MTNPLSPRDRYHMVTVPIPIGDELHAHLMRSHAEANARLAAQRKKPIKLAPHLRELWRTALDATAFPTPRPPHKPRHRKVE